MIEQVDTLTTTGDYLEPGVEYRVEIQVTTTNTVWIKDWYLATETKPGIQELTLNGLFDTAQSGPNMFDWVALGANTDADVEITDIKLESTVHAPFFPVSQFYRYDPLGRRIERTTDDGLGNVETTRYFYDGWRVCEEQNASQTTQATYVYGRYVDEVITMERGSEEFYYHCDDLYNVVALTDATGAVVETYAYDDYGQPHITDATGMSVMQSAVGNPYLFNGRRYDPETGYYYYRTRYLDPHTGRFISRDTIGIWGDPNNLGNGYSYAGNNPWTMVDPFGEKFGMNVVGEAIGGFCSSIGDSLLGMATMGKRGRDPLGQADDYAESAPLLSKGTYGALYVSAGASALGILGYAAAPALVTAEIGVGTTAALGTTATTVSALAQRTPRNIPNCLSAEKRRALRSLWRQVDDHIQKLNQYKNNPYAHDNRGFLGRDPMLDKKIIQARIDKLEREIAKFLHEIEKILKGCC